MPPRGHEARDHLRRRLRVGAAEQAEDLIADELDRLIANSSSPVVNRWPLAKGGDVAKRAFTAMMPMRKIDVAAIEAAVKG